MQGRVGRVAAVDACCADWGQLCAALGDLRRLKSWVEGREVAFAQLTAKVSSFPEKSLAEAGRTSLRKGEQLLKRAETAEAVPSFLRSCEKLNALQDNDAVGHEDDVASAEVCAHAAE